MSNTLSQNFSGAAIKYLSNVEVRPSVSNQHELNGITPLRDLFGTARQEFNTSYMYLDKDEVPRIACNGFMTWYDARENHPTRTEYRLYYDTNPVMNAATNGDLMFLGLRPDGSLVAAVTKQGSPAQKYLEILFGRQRIQIDLR